MFRLVILFSLRVSLIFSKLACQTPGVCDPGLETDIFLESQYLGNESECESLCQTGHPNNPCKFFTWVPTSVPNCYLLRACNTMAHPMAGSKSGAWSCDDPDIFCGSIGDTPAYDDKKTVWTCDHDEHPYGDGSKFVFQSSTCRSSCPSFEYQTVQNKNADIVVTSTCLWDRATDTSIWGPADPSNVIDSSGTVIESALANPTPGCGCKDLVLPGIVSDETGKKFECKTDPNYNGDTIISQDNECFLECDGMLVFDLFCSVGQWSVDYITSAADVYCFGEGSTDAQVTISTYWPPDK